MTKVSINWTTTTTEHFKIEVDESKLPADWREQLDSATTSGSAFLGDYEYEHGESTGFDEDVVSREAVYTVLDKADYEALEQALTTVHIPTYVPSKKYLDLFTVLCSCGESSFGASLRETAETLHARHVSDPAGQHFRDRAVPRPFAAAHSGICVACDDSFFEGDLIIHARGGWAHEVCPQEKPTGAQCTTCSTAAALNGQCLC